MYDFPVSYVYELFPYPVIMVVPIGNESRPVGNDPKLKGSDEMAKANKKVETPTLILALTGFRIEDIVSAICESTDWTRDNFGPALVADPLYSKVTRYGDMKYAGPCNELGIGKFSDDPTNVWDFAMKVIEAKVAKIRKNTPKPKFLDRVVSLLTELVGDTGETCIMVSHADMLARGFPVSCVKYKEYFGNPTKEPGKRANSGHKALYSISTKGLFGTGKDMVWTVENTNPTDKDTPIDPNGLLVWELVSRESLAK